MLAFGGVSSTAVTAFHVVCGFDTDLALHWGAPPMPEAQLRLASFAVAAVFAAWAAYAFSGAGLLRPLPLLRLGVWIIGGIYTLRGLALFVEIGAHVGTAQRVGLRPSHMLWASAVALAIGLVHLAGMALSRGGHGRV